eukprot:COSAG02_NODE_5878_length_3967_cov_22.152017_1_plen_675_part_10
MPRTAQPKSPTVRLEEEATPEEPARFLQADAAERDSSEQSPWQTPVRASARNVEEQPAKSWEQERQQLLQGRKAWKEQALLFESKLASAEEAHAAMLAQAVEEKRDEEVERLSLELHDKRAIVAEHEQLLPEIFREVAALKARTQAAEEEASVLRKELEESRAHASAASDSVSELETKLKTAETAHAAGLAAAAASHTQGFESDAEEWFPMRALRDEDDPTGSPLNAETCAAGQAVRVAGEAALREAVDSNDFLSWEDGDERWADARGMVVSVRPDLDSAMLSIREDFDGEADAVDDISVYALMADLDAERSYRTTLKQELVVVNSGRDEALDELQSLRATCQRQAADIDLAQATSAFALAQKDSLLADARSQLATSQSKLQSQQKEHSAALTEKDEAIQRLTKKNEDAVVRGRAEARAETKREFAEVMQTVQNRIAGLDAEVLQSEAHVERLTLELHDKRAVVAEHEQLLPEIFREVAAVKARTQAAEEEASVLRKELEESQSAASSAGAASDRVSELETKLKTAEEEHAAAMAAAATAAQEEQEMAVEFVEQQLAKTWEQGRQQLLQGRKAWKDQALQSESKLAGAEEEHAAMLDQAATERRDEVERLRRELNEQTTELREELDREKASNASRLEKLTAKAEEEASVLRKELEESQSAASSAGAASDRVSELE